MRLAWIALVAACGGDGSKSIDAATTVDAAPDSSACSPFIMYLNKSGGTYSPGTDDATINRSSVLTANTTITAPTIDPNDWPVVLQCVRDKFTMFDVNVVDVDPSPVPHVEVVVLMSGSQIGQPGLSTGAPATPCAGGFGTATRNTIAYATWEGNNPNRCWNIAQALGYTMGLDNVLPCEDVMSVMATPCSILGKQYTDMAAQCGQIGAQPCRCGGQMQNAKQRVLANIGARCN